MENNNIISRRLSI